MIEDNELYEQLAASIASPVAQALHQHVLSGDKAETVRILEGEGYSPSGASMLYDICREKWLGTDVDLVEVPLCEVEALVRCEVSKAEKAGTTEPDYVVRHGITIVSIWPMIRRGELEFYSSKQGTIPLRGIQQFWKIVPKSSRTKLP